MQVRNEQSGERRLLGVEGSVVSGRDELKVTLAGKQSGGHGWRK